VEWTDDQKVSLGLSVASALLFAGLAVVGLLRELEPTKSMWGAFAVMPVRLRPSIASFRFSLITFEGALCHSPCGRGLVGDIDDPSRRCLDSALVDSRRIPASNGSRLTD
jgi:hypothetical protein